MSEDISKLIGTMLSNPDALKNLLGSAGQQLQAPPGNDNANIQNLVSALNSNDDKRVTLLNALKPYMNPAKSASIDKAIQLIKLTAVTEVLRKEGKL